MDALPCPSFNAYASATDTADKVTRESIEDYCFLEPSKAQLRLENYEDGDFEFVTFHTPADEVYLDSRVDPVYPIFNRNASNENIRYGKSQKNEFAIPENREAAGTSLQTSLRNLFINEEDHRRIMINPPSSSSSEADELDSIPPDSYCVWTPDSAKASPSHCKKSKSTGSSSSKRWKLLEFLCRSNSDGRDKFVFLTPSPMLKKKEAKSEISKEEWSSSPGSVNIPDGNKVATSTEAKMSSSSAVARGRSQRKVSAHEVFYVSYRASKEADKKRSYLPYRQELVAFGAKLGGFGTKFPPS